MALCLLLGIHIAVVLIMVGNSNTQLAMQAAGSHLQAGNIDKAVKILQDLISKDENNGDAWTALAICYQKAGQKESYCKALDKALLLQPQNIKTLIMYGLHYETEGELSAAIKKYSAALSHSDTVPPSAISLLNDLEKIRTRLPILTKQLEQRIESELLEFGLGDQLADRRFNMALDIMYGRKNIFYQEPHQFYFPELPQRQFYDPKEFSWFSDLTNRWEDIRDEAVAIMAEREKYFAPYLISDPSQAVSEDITLLDNDDWSAYYLIKDSVPQNDNIKRCPVTMSALERAPLSNVPGQTPSVLFSLLQPDTHIVPHSGMLNTRLICHLPLVVPDGCGFRVGNEEIEWQPGIPVIFDDSIEHEAWNRGIEQRIILLFEIWRPELSQREQELISKLLQASA